MTVFAHGGLRLYLLMLLADQPRHGYELIRMVEDRFLGLYTPSPGTVYPRLAALEDDGLVEHEEVDGRKVYRLTAAGRAELEARRDDLDDLQASATRSVRALAHEIRDEVRASVRDVRRELKDAVRDVRREERRMAREVRETVRESVREPGRHRHGRGDGRFLLHSLRHDLEAFVGDVVAAARRHDLTAERVRDVRDVLVDARQAVMDALNGAGGRDEAAADQPPEGKRT